MTEMQLDYNDFVALPLFLIGSLGTLGLISFELAGISLADTLVTFTSDGGFQSSITIGTLLALLGLGIVLYTNSLSFDTMSSLQGWMTAIILWLILSPPFVPLMDQLVVASDVGSLVAVTIQSVGFGYLSYLG